MTVLFPGVLAIVLLLAAPLAPAHDAAAVRAAVDAGNLSFSKGLEAKSAARMASNYAPGARLIPPGEADAVGAAEIEKYWQGMLDHGTVGIKLVTEEFETSGDLAVERGRAELTFADPKTPPATVKYLVVWRLQPDDSWKILFDTWNDPPKPQPAATATSP